jgi:hypothetical protein
MLADGKNWIVMPASFMVLQSWKDSLHPKRKKVGRIPEEIKLQVSGCHRKLFNQPFKFELWYVKRVRNILIYIIYSSFQVLLVYTTST